MKVDKHLVSLGLAAAAGAIGAMGHDGWGWFLVVIVMIEC
jgi:hypothetical protein